MQADDYTIIDRYLQGELPEKEKSAFLDRLKGEPDLAAELELREQMNTYLRTQSSLPALEKKIAGLGSEHFGESGEAHVRVLGRRRQLYFGLAIAAAIALLLTVWNPFSSSGLYGQFADHPPLALVEKGADQELLEAAAIAYEEQDFQRAYESLKQVAEIEENPQLQLALGISALELEKVEEAQIVFAELAAGNTALRDYGQWYRILSYIKQENYTTAKELLQNNQLGDPALAEKAAALLKALD